jgi:hypothetical protein
MMAARELPTNSTSYIQGRHVRPIQSRSSAAFLVAVVAVLLWSVPSGAAHAQSRSFQMGLWVSPDNAIPTVGVDTDIQAFYEGQNQPPGRSILLVLNWTSSAPLAGRHPYDWSRIVAVEVNDPHSNVMGTDNPCPNNMTLFNFYEAILADKAAQLKAIAPRARFWVTFTPSEMDWMVNSPTSPVQINRDDIDVISVDNYDVDFNPGVEQYYDWLLNPSHRVCASQQIALIPATHVKIGHNTADGQAIRLQAYFDYANAHNQTCGLELGARGLTGNYDRCPVWIVLGFLAADATVNGTEYAGLLDPRVRNTALDTTWHQQLNLPLRSDLARQMTPGQILESILPRLSDH